MNPIAQTQNVLTLEEVAAYLRLPTETVLHQATQGKLPGRKIEDTWRFLQAAIDDWLRSQDNRTVLLQQAGAFSDDESLVDLRAEIYQARGRSELDEGSDR
ncbi:MAG: helix-turn-helix domain-containing protein [Lyngbya sp. HA4199-MV5]|jgi:excisionase family DNA binding protein|nr:helix-turn-helix domain-containing protein [Lyngbya sp. HA4199-MV5]